MINLLREYMKRRFFENKQKEINEYITAYEECDESKRNRYVSCEYTNGTPVVVDTLNHKAYTRNGFLFSVILKDEEYLNKFGADMSLVLEYLDKMFGEKYSDEESEEEIED